jgi:hypothetical protein
MSEMPPMDLVREKLLFGVLPTALAVALAFAVGVLLAWWIVGRVLRNHWRVLAPTLAVLALAAGLVASPLLGSWNRDRIATAKASGDDDRAKELARTYLFETPFPWVPDGKWWHWGWYAIGLALAVESVVRLPGVRVGVGHLFRGVAAGVIAAVLVLPRFLLKSDKPTPIVFEPEALWHTVLTAVLMAVTWAVVDAVGRRNPGGSVASAMAIVCGGAAVVLIHDAAAGYTDVATFLLTGLAVLSLAAWVTGTDVGAAGAAAVVPVATLLLLNREPESTSKVPVVAYWLVGLAPLTLAMFLFPPITRFGLSRWATPVKWLLVAIPVGIAVYRCVTEAPLKFGEEQW